MARMNSNGMTFSEWRAGATWGARWSYGDTRLRRAWNADEDFADYASMFQNPSHPERGAR